MATQTDIERIFAELGELRREIAELKEQRGVSAALVQRLERKAEDLTRDLATLLVDNAGKLARIDQEQGTLRDRVQAVHAIARANADRSTVTASELTRVKDRVAVVERGRSATTVNVRFAIQVASSSGVATLAAWLLTR